MRTSKGLVLVVFALGCAVAPRLALGAFGTSGQAAPLPDLALEKLPGHVRTAIERAYADAKRHPEESSAIGRLAMILHAYEQHTLAATCYDRARALDPESLAWRYLAGVVAAELGEDARATSHFRGSLALDPGHLPARVRLAGALLASGNLDESRAEYEALVRSFPELALAHFGLGRIASAVGDSRTAAAHYERAVGVAPQFGRAHYALALVLRNLGQAERARAHMAEHARIGPREPAVPDRLLDGVRSLRSTARDLIEDGARLGREGRLQDAIALHLKAIEIDPASAQAHVNLISLYGRTGRPAEAERHFQAAVALQSNLAMAHYNYGVLLAASGRPSDAAASFERTLEIDPFHAPAHNNLGAILAAQGRTSDAAAHYRRALASDPQHRGARFGLARILASERRTREAIEHLERILEPEDADTPRYKYALARAWFHEGERDKALSIGREAVAAATRLGQTELAARMQQELRKMTGHP